MMVCANGRILKPELLDNAPPDERRRNLRDLALINRWLGGRLIFRGLLDRIAHPSEPLQCWHRTYLHHTCSLMLLPLGFRSVGYRGDRNERANRA